MLDTRDGLGVYQSRSRFSIILPFLGGGGHGSLLYSVPSVPELRASLIQFVRDYSSRLLFDLAS